MQPGGHIRRQPRPDNEKYLLYYEKNKSAHIVGGAENKKTKTKKINITWLCFRYFETIFRFGTSSRDSGEQFPFVTVATESLKPKQPS